jgi:Spy/CpxP family protein refolding chaperone
MSRTKGMALAFYLVAVVAGAAVGVTVDRWVLRERLVNEWADPRAMRTKLADDLKLDVTQRAKLDTILDSRNTRFDALMAPVRPALDSVSATARQQIRDLLTPEQVTIYDQMQRERETARQQEKKR